MVAVRSKYHGFYVSGVTTSVGKKICKCFFGDSLRLFSPNLIEKTFDIYVVMDERITKEYVEYFVNFWGEGWRVFEAPEQLINQNE